MPGCYDAVGNAPAGGCQAGSVRLHNQMMDRWGLGSFGCYNPRSRVGSGWSLHREGRAIDVAVGTHQRREGLEAFHWAIDNADAIGLQEIQHQGRIWTSKRAGEGIRGDSPAGAAAHWDHIHLGQCWRGALYYQPAPIPPVRPPTDWAGLWKYLRAVLDRGEAEMAAGVVYLGPNRDPHTAVVGPNNKLEHHYWFNGDVRKEGLDTQHEYDEVLAVTKVAEVFQILARRTDGAAWCHWFTTRWNEKPY